MMASRKKLLIMAVAMVFLFFVADSVLARGGRGGGGRGGGRGGGGRSSGKSFSRHSGGSSHSIRNSGGRSHSGSSRGGSYNRNNSGKRGGSRDRYGGGGRYDRPSTGRPGYDRPSTGRPADRPGLGDNRPGDRPGRPGDRPGRPGDRPGSPGHGNYKDPYSQAYKNQKSWQNTRQQIAKSHYDDRREWAEDYWRWGHGRYAGVRIYYSVPCTYTVNVVNGHTYYQCGSVWYNRVYSDSQVTYIVVTAP